MQANLVKYIHHVKQKEVKARLSKSDIHWIAQLSCRALQKALQIGLCKLHLCQVNMGIP